MDIPIRTVPPQAAPSFLEAVYAWRGECMALYAKGERVIADCLEAVRNADVPLSKESSHPGHRARARSLSEILAEMRFRGHSRKAAEHLALWQSDYDLRVFLAHGDMTVREKSLILAYCDYSNGSLTMRQRTFEADDMSALLSSLRMHLSAMDQQFGQIKAACARGDI